MAAATRRKTRRRRPVRTKQAKPWDQQPDESDVAFDAFRRYRDMGSARSSAKVGQELGKSKTLMDRWCGRWRWVTRVEAWKQEEDRLFDEEMREARMLMARQHERIASSMLNKAVAKLQEMDGTKLTDRAFIDLVDVATKVHRAAVGDPHPTRLEHSGPDGGPIQVESDDEISLLAELQIIAGVMSERMGADGA